MSGRWFYFHAYLNGARRSLGVAAMVLSAASIGFGALARQTGFDLIDTLATMALVWALPGQVILLTMISAKATLAATALAVTLSAVRLLPMVTSILPLIRGRETPRWPLFLVAHLIAATTWLEARRMAPDLPGEQRVSFTLGHGSGLFAIVAVMITSGYMSAAILPAKIVGTLMFLIPIYFLTALFMTAKARADHISIVAGLTLGPLFAVLTPTLDLMLAGLIGGTLAYCVHRWRGQQGS